MFFFSLPFFYQAHGQLPVAQQWNVRALHPIRIVLRGVALRLVEIGRVPWGTTLYDDSMIGGQLFNNAFPPGHFNLANPTCMLDLHFM